MRRNIRQTGSLDTPPLLGIIEPTDLREEDGQNAFSEIRRVVRAGKTQDLFHLDALGWAGCLRRGSSQP